MSNPSVTASVTVDDKASPRLRELVELAQKLNKAAQAAFSESGADRYVASLNSATAAARQHLTALERVQKVQSAILASTAGIAGAKAIGAAKNAIANFIPYERDVRYQRAIQSYSNADMALLERQRVSAAATYGLSAEDTLHAQQAFVTRNFSAAITEAGTKQAIVLSKALNVKADEAAKIVEGLTFGQGIHLRSPADASREIAKSTDIAAIAAKSGSMTPEDIQQFAKFGIGMSTAAGINAQQAFAAAMTLKRANVGGDESGVFMRQMSARLLAPTKQAFDAFAHMGIDYSKFATQGNVSPDAIDAALRRGYGKGLSPAGKASLAAAFGDEGRNVLSSREDFTAAVREAVEASGEKLSKTDQKHLVNTALRQYDLAKGGLRGGDLFNEILSKASPRDLQAIIGDKQGGRAVMLLSALDQYREYLEKLTHGGGYAERIAQERMEGLAAAVDRFSASLDMASKQMVAANEGWITPMVDAAGKLVGVFTGLSDSAKTALSVSAGLASLAGLSSAGATVLSVVSSLSSLSVSANTAAAALARVGVTGGLPTGAPGVPNKGAQALSAVSSLFAWSALGTAAVSAVIEALNHVPSGGPRSSRGFKGAAVAAPVASTAEFEDLISESGRFGTYKAGPFAKRRGATREYLHSLLDEPPTGGSWVDSAVAPGPASGPAKWGELSGTVRGSAELHQNLTIEVRPTAYFESLVKQAEASARIGIEGRLGTSMRGGGDNSPKPSGGPITAPIGAQ